MAKSVFLTGASGVGKTTVLHELAGFGMVPSPNHLSRPPRGSEVHGLDAYFVTPPQFEHNFAQGTYLERSLDEAGYLGNYYGSPKAWAGQIGGERPIVATPAKIPVLEKFCEELSVRGIRQRLLWVHLVADEEVRRDRLAPRTPDPALLEQRLNSGDPYGEQQAADLNLDTNQPLQDVLGVIMTHTVLLEMTEA